MTGPGLQPPTPGALRHRADEHQEPPGAAVRRSARVSSSSRRRAAGVRVTITLPIRTVAPEDGRMRLKVLVVDDEPLAREGLKLLLGRQPQVESVSEARNGREAVALIREQKPDLVLLDVQMPRIDGFAVVHAIGAERMPAVIFVTAHDQYAIRAFEIAAIDYLLKPVTEERFALAFERAVRPGSEAAARGGHATGARDARCHRESAAAARRDSRFDPASGRIFVPVDEVDWIEAFQNYVRLHVGPGDPSAARADEHDRGRARSRPLPAHPSVAHRERPAHRAAVVARARPVRHRAQVRAAPAIGAHLRRADPPRALEPVLIRSAICRLIRCSTNDRSSATAESLSRTSWLSLRNIFVQWHLIDQHAHTTPCAPCSNRVDHVVVGRLRWQRQQADAAEQPNPVADARDRERLHPA